MKTKQMQMIGDCYCPLCAVAISTHDPEKVVRGGIAYHHGCIKKAVEAVKPAVQRYFRFEQGLYVH